MRLTILDNTTSRVIPISVALSAVALLPLIVVRVLGDPFQAPRALVAAAAVTIVLALAANAARGPKAPRTAGLLLAGLCAWYVIAALASHPGSTIWGVQGRLQGIMTFMLLVAAAVAGTLLPRARAVTLAVAVAATTSVVACVTLFQVVMGRVPEATFGNSTIAGAWLAVGSAVALGASQVHPRSSLRPWLLAAAGLGAVATGASGSRAAVLAVLSAGIVTLAARRGVARKTLVLSLVASLLLLSAGITVASTRGKFTPEALVSGSAKSRVEIWRSTARMVAAHPLLGVGPGRFLYEFPAFQTIEHAVAEGPDVRPDQAHSQPLQYAAEAGIPAALALVALAGLCVATAWRGARAGDGAAFVALVGLTAYVVQSLFGVAAVETDVLGWLLAGIAVSSGREASTARGSAIARVLALAGAVCVIAMSAWYVTANSAYARGIDRYALGDFAVSAAALGRAVALDPLTDVYRVAEADTASFAAVGLERALASLDEGLVIEPHSYDLALARARLLSLMGREPVQVAGAYRRALELYPRGVTVRREAAAAFRAAGLADEAAKAEQPLQTLSPAPRDAP